MKYEYDIITIGLGPAGMAVAIMGSEMGLKVCAIEKNKIGGECMNVGCIPSKSLLRMAQARHLAGRLGTMELDGEGEPGVLDPFGRVRDYVKYINEKKTLGMFKKVQLVLGRGSASFVDAHTVEAGGKRYTAKRIFVAAGTHPMIPPIDGIGDVEYLTNETLFDLESLPGSMVVLGGGAIGCEMAQAFSRLGCKCSIIHMDPYLLPAGEEDVGIMLEERFEEEGIRVLNGRKIMRIEKAGDFVRVHSDREEVLEGEKLLVAAGRKIDLSELNPGAAGVELTPRGGVKVNRHLQTTKKNIYGVGDCNGHFLLTHAAMHQGMIALMNSMMPALFRMDFRKFVVPWTVFTEPQVSHVGKRAAELDRRGIRYETVETRYEDYGAAIAEGVGVGFLKVYASKTGRIYGARIVGEGSGEMINEWALAIQKRVRMHDIMMLQHSFPSMSFLTKRIGETWMMKRMESPVLKDLCRFFFRI